MSEYAKGMVTPLTVRGLRMKQQEIPVEEFLPLALCAAGAAGVFPFAIIRLVQGDWFTAAFDLALVCSLVGLALYLRKSQNIRLVSMLLAAFCVGGMLVTIGLRGAEHIMWAYPALLSLFFLVKRQEALIGASLVIAALAYMLYPEVQGLSLIHI